MLSDSLDQPAITRQSGLVKAGITIGAAVLALLGVAVFWIQVPRRDRAYLESNVAQVVAVTAGWRSAATVIPPDPASWRAPVLALPSALPSPTETHMPTSTASPIRRPTPIEVEEPPPPPPSATSRPTALPTSTALPPTPTSLPILTATLAPSVPTDPPVSAAAVLPAPADPSSDPLVAGLAERINRARVEAGLHPLAWSADLAEAAQAQAEDMASHGFVDHTGSDGSEVGERMRRTGYSPAFRGEIIAWVPAGPELAFAWWWNSPLHHNTMLGESYRDFGVARVPHPTRAGHNYFVVVFGSR